MTSTSVKTVCPYCGVGCGMALDVQGGKVIKVSGLKNHPTNFGRLCTKGSTSAQALRESGRMEAVFGQGRGCRAQAGGAGAWWSERRGRHRLRGPDVEGEALCPRRLLMKEWSSSRSSRTSLRPCFAFR
ncbi:hypothetical protein I4I83_00915 [Acidovorax cattleyae]|nr:hypothetical protein [Paracidovorax cattleyae]